MNYEDIDHLLPRYCEGLATEEECRQVESWMEESEDNRKIVDQINTLYIAVDTVNVMRKVDTEKALKKVSSRMIVRKTTWWEWMQRVAAILFIPLSVALSGAIYAQWEICCVPDDGNKNQPGDDNLGGIAR